MIYIYIALGFMGLSFTGMLVILIRKFPQLKTVDVGTIVEEKEARLRDRIMLERLDRRTDVGKKLLVEIITPVVQVLKNLFTSFYEWIVVLEKKYKEESERLPNPQDPEFNAKVRHLLEDARRLIKKEKYGEAEKKYIEIISASPKNCEVYQGLADLYIVQREFTQAIQTLQYVLKLDSRSSDSCRAQEMNRDYLRLGEAYAMSGQTANAFVEYQKALELVNNDPKTLDLLIETAIILRDKSSALDYLKKMQSVNPENQKLPDLQNQINDL
jgi:tetratricopeptide (TPR) repeat protein